MTVDSPSPNVGATHVAVGCNVVWALTKDNKVRKFCITYNTAHYIVMLHGFQWQDLFV